MKEVVLVFGWRLVFGAVSFITSLVLICMLMVSALTARMRKLH